MPAGGVLPPPSGAVRSTSRLVMTTPTSLRASDSSLASAFRWVDCRCPWPSSGASAGAGGQTEQALLGDVLGNVGLDGYGATVDVHGAPVGRGVELLPVAAELSCVICGSEDSS
jgi:hypothetical protein